MNKIEESLHQAVAFAKGEKPAARITVKGHAYVPEAALSALEAALRPLADLGIAKRETDIALLDYNLPFYDCPDDLVLYDDKMGHAITVGDVRAARAALKVEEGT